MCKTAAYLSVFFLCLDLLPAGEGPGSTTRQEFQITLSDGRLLNYQEYGKRNGRLVLWFHGLSSSCRVPEIVAGEIRESGLRVICIDRPGIGKSTFSKGRTILDWTDDVEEFLCAIGYREKRFGIITTSGGSSYGCACAFRFPDRVTHLALVSPYAPLDAPGVEPGNSSAVIRLTANHPILARAMMKPLIKNLDSKPDQVMERLKKKYSPSDVALIYDIPANYQNQVENLRHITAQGPRGVVKDTGLHASERGFELSEIDRVPVTIWSGGEDPVAPPSMSQFFHDQIKGSRLITGENDGHSTLLKSKARAILAQF